MKKEYRFLCGNCYEYVNSSSKILARIRLIIWVLTKTKWGIWSALTAKCEITNISHDELV